MQIETLITTLNKHKKKAKELMIESNGILFPVKRVGVKDGCIVLTVSDKPSNQEVSEKKQAGAKVKEVKKEQGEGKVK